MATRTGYVVAIYLASIVVANLLAAWLLPVAPWVTLPIGFVLIGLDLTTRDVLHDRWGNQRVRNMTALILSGSAISAVLNWQAAPVALASALAFGTATTGDGLVYQWLHRRHWLTRANSSNVVGAWLDSLVFIGTLVALGALPIGALWLAAPQAFVKAAGGLVWSLVIVRWRYATEKQAHSTV